MPKETYTTNASLGNFALGGQSYAYYSLKQYAVAQGAGGVLDRLPVSIKILLENILRHQESGQVSQAALDTFFTWPHVPESVAIPFFPSRVLMQDFAGPPAFVDLAAMRDAVAQFGGNPMAVTPRVPVDLVIDHSVVAEFTGTSDALALNLAAEFAQNKNRYRFLKWGQKAFPGVRIIPPGAGICHQLNLEYLTQGGVRVHDGLVYPDTLVGTDSHTTMINALSVLGWGVGGIEAEAVMLGHPLWMTLPRVVGVHLKGRLKPGILATDLVLGLTKFLRAHGVVSKFLEFWGEGLNYLTLSDRATIANMAPEFGATCAFFPVDEMTCSYLEMTGRSEETVALVRAYAQIQGLWRSDVMPLFSETLEIDLATLERTMAGPKRPQDAVQIENVAHTWQVLPETPDAQPPLSAPAEGLRAGAVVIAAITSCTNTSNPEAILTAALVAQKAAACGLSPKPWVKTSFAPGSQVVSDYVQAVGLQDALDALGFQVVGYGCTTCIGNSGSLAPEVAEVIQTQNLDVAAVLSGNRNFEGRIHPLVKLNYLASPPLVVAYALAGNLDVNLAQDPLGMDPQGQPVYLEDLWPTAQEIQDVMKRAMDPTLFIKRYAHIMEGSPAWQELPCEGDARYAWDEHNTYVRKPPYFEGFSLDRSAVTDITGAYVLLSLGDSVTTDHISPAGHIATRSPAGLYLESQGVLPKDFNSYGARRGNHEVMVRGAFSNPRLQNELTPDIKGGYAHHIPSQQVLSVFEAASAYRQDGIPLVIVAGREYGSGSSRDWAAKGPSLLGVRAVVAESFERIHRSNLIGMGILPLLFPERISRHTLNLTGDETVDILGISSSLAPGATLVLQVTQAATRETMSIPVRCAIQTQEELQTFQEGGLMPAMVRKILKNRKA